MIDLILLGIMLSGMDRLEACRRITAAEWLQDIPIIVITVKTDEQVLVAAFAAGEMEYIRKPVNPAELVARVSSALALKKEPDTRKARDLPSTVFRRWSGLSSTARVEGV